MSKTFSRVVGFSGCAFFSILLASCSCGVEPTLTSSSSGTGNSLGSALSSAAAIPAGSRELKVELNDDLKLKLDESLKLKLKLKLKAPGRKSAPGAQTWNVFAVTPGGQLYPGTMLPGNLWSLALPTNQAYSLLFMVAETNFTNAMLLTYRDGAPAFRVAPGLNNAMDAIILGLPFITNGQLLSSTNPAASVDSTGSGTNDAQFRTNRNSFDQDGDTALDFYGAIDSDLNGVPDALELLIGTKAFSNKNTGGVLAVFAVSNLSTNAQSSNTNALVYQALIAAEPALSFYSGTPAWSNSAVSFALATNLPDLQLLFAVSWSNIAPVVALSTQFQSIIPPSFAGVWSNTVADVVFDPAFTNYIGSGLAGAVSNAYSNISTNAAWYSNSYSTNWTDTVAPQFVQTGPLNGAVTNASGFLFSGSLAADPSGVQQLWLRLDSNSFFLAASNAGAVAIGSNFGADGAHTLAWYTLDALSNRSATDSVSVTVDTLPPTFTLTGPTNGQILTNLQFTFSGTLSADPSGAQQLWLELGTNAFFLLASNSGAVSLATNWTAQGSNSIAWRTRDGLSNQSTNSSLSVWVDTFAPNAGYFNLSNGQQISSHEYLYVGTLDFDPSGVQRFWMKIDTNGWALLATVPGDFNYVISNLSDGPHTLLWYTEDGYNNQSMQTTVNFTNDAALPQISVDTFTNGQYLIGGVDLISGVATVDPFYSISAMGSVINGMSNNLTLSGSSTVLWTNFPPFETTGSYAVTVWAVSSGGRTNQISNNYRVDSIGPSVSVNGITDGQQLYTNSLTIEGSAGDNFWVDRVLLFVDTDAAVQIGGGSASVSFTNTLVLADGAHTVTIWVQDGAGNSNSTGTFNLTVVTGALYVSYANGDDSTNNGSIQRKFATLAKAVDVAKQNRLTEIRVDTSATLTPGSGLQNMGNTAGLLIDGATNLTIRGGYDAGFSSAGSTTVMNGTSSVGSVVAISNSQGLRLENFTIQGGSGGVSDGTYGFGAGVLAVSTVQLVMSNILVSGNSAQCGAGIALLSCSNALISGVIYGNSYGEGQSGAIDVENCGNIVLTQSLVTANEGAGSGGGLNVTNSSDITIAGCVFSNNIAYNIGGAVCARTVERLRIVNSTFASNDCNGGSGGALYAEGLNHSVIDADFISNLSSGSGGAIYLTASHSNSIAGAVAGNLANNNGGGMWISGNSNSFTGSFSGNAAADFSAGAHYFNGGGIYLSAVTNFTLSAQVCSNIAQNGGGVYIENSSGLRIDGTNASNAANMDVNMSQNGYGGGIYLSNVNGVQLTALISTNTAQRGGGLYADTLDTGDLSGTVESNYAYDSGSGGGGLYFTNTSNATVNAVLDANKTGGLGGGIYLADSHSNRVLGALRNNGAFMSGGGIYATAVSKTVFAGALLSNSATMMGGSVGGAGLFLANGSSNTLSGDALGNTTPGNGGGLYLMNSDHLTVTGTVAGNLANYSSSYGGGIYAQNVVLSSFGCPVLSNYSMNYGGGFYADGLEGSVVSGTILSNYASYQGGGLYLYNSYTNTVSASIISNSAGNSGGGLYLGGGGSNSVSGVLQGNAAYDGASSGNGGNLFASGCDETWITSDILDGFAGNSGGGAYFSSCLNTLIEGNHVIGNSSLLEEGFAFTCNEAVSNFVLSSSLVSNNFSSNSTNGLFIGTIYLTRSDMPILDFMITNTTLSGMGADTTMIYDSCSTFIPVSLVTNTVYTDTFGHLFLYNDHSTTNVYVDSYSNMTSANLGGTVTNNVYISGSVTNTL